jgi:hypothetical protein
LVLSLAEQKKDEFFKLYYFIFTSDWMTEF